MAVPNSVRKKLEVKMTKFKKAVTQRRKKIIISTLLILSIHSVHAADKAEQKDSYWQMGVSLWNAISPGSDTQTNTQQNPPSAHESFEFTTSPENSDHDSEDDEFLLITPEQEGTVIDEITTTLQGQPSTKSPQEGRIRFNETVGLATAHTPGFAASSATMHGKELTSEAIRRKRTDNLQYKVKKGLAPLRTLTQEERSELTPDRLASYIKNLNIRVKNLRSLSKIQALSDDQKDLLAIYQLILDEESSPESSDPEQEGTVIDESTTTLQGQPSEKPPQEGRIRFNETVSLATAHTPGFAASSATMHGKELTSEAIRRKRTDNLQHKVKKGLAPLKIYSKKERSELTQNRLASYIKNLNIRVNNLRSLSKTQALSADQQKLLGIYQLILYQESST